MGPRALFLTIALLAAALVPPATASQTTAGRNGRVTFTRNGDIFSMRPDGTNALRLTRTAASEWDPQWSPDGTMISFIRSLSEAPWSALWVMQADGSNKHKVSGAFEGSIQHPAWSPDGAKIAYTDLDISNPDARAPYPSAVRVIDVDSSTDIGLTTMASESGQPIWSPDSARILFTSTEGGDETDMWMMNSDGTDPVKLLDSPGQEFDAAWSPDGTRIAFSQPEGSSPQAKLVLHVMDADGGNVTAVTDGTLEDRYAEWSPDSSLLLISRADARYRSDLWVVNPDGTGLVDVTGPGVRAESYNNGVWSPNSAKVLFSAGGDLYTRRLAGGIRRLTNTRGAEFPGAWQAR